LNKSRSRHVNGDVAPNLFRNIYNVYKSISWLYMIFFLLVYIFDYICN
jgi:hypothetical protein